MVISTRTDPYVEDMGWPREAKTESAYVLPKNLQQPRGVAYFIRHPDENGVTQTLVCESDQEAKVFLEMLLNQGTTQHQIEVFQADKATFGVSYKPEVTIAPGDATEPEKAAD